jgi:hypothetical protein
VMYKYHLLLLHCGSCLLCTVVGSHTSNYVTAEDNSALGLYGKFVILCSLSRDCSKSPVGAIYVAKIYMLENFNSSCTA